MHVISSLIYTAAVLLEVELNGNLAPSWWPEVH